MIYLGKIGMMCLFLTASAWAQHLISVKAGLINFAEGSVYIGERQLQFPANDSQILKVGESLSTGFGSVEIQLGPAAFLRIGAGGLLRMENSALTNMQFQVNRGSIMIEIFDEVDDNKIWVHFKDATIELKEKGLYRLDCSLSRLRVYGGKAKIRQPQKVTTLKRGKAAILGDTKVSEFDMEEKDILHQWAAKRSFTLYIMNEDTRRSWDHWTHLSGGWMQNKLYGVKAHSPIAYEEQALMREREQALQEREKLEQKAWVMRQEAERRRQEFEDALRRQEDALRRQTEESRQGYEAQQQTNSKRPQE